MVQSPWGIRAFLTSRSSEAGEEGHQATARDLNGDYSEEEISTGLHLYLRTAQLRQAHTITETDRLPRGRAVYPSGRAGLQSNPRGSGYETTSQHPPSSWHDVVSFLRSKKSQCFWQQSATQQLFRTGCFSVCHRNAHFLFFLSQTHNYLSTFPLNTEALKHSVCLIPFINKIQKLSWRTKTISSEPLRKYIKHNRKSLWILIGTADN